MERLTQSWHLTARRGYPRRPLLKDLFSNFLNNKRPDSLFRRINPEYYYPSFGRRQWWVEENCAGPWASSTSKRATARIMGCGATSRLLTWAMSWLTSTAACMEADAHYGTGLTSFGRATDHGGTVFAAQPGTLPSYEQFLGTGGSLYFLHHQDISDGPPRRRAVLKSATRPSNIVTGVVNLRPNVDYDIDYLQGPATAFRAASRRPLTTICWCVPAA